MLRPYTVAVQHAADDDDTVQVIGHDDESVQRDISEVFWDLEPAAARGLTRRTQMDVPRSHRSK